MNYRPEIDGLRAVAVVPVVLFHAGFVWFSGGYVGVDVFFVISGYLITAVISEEVREGKFTLTSFYERRARRILPALYLVLLTTIPFAWFWMWPGALRNFFESLITVVVFLSNIFFWQERGYFDAVGELKPLLHTWSLAVEEQFYLIFPVLLALLWKFGRKSAFFAIALAALLSFVVAEWASVNRPGAGFYLIVTRAWELLIGALAALYLGGRQGRSPDLSGPTREVAAIIGLAAIGVSIVAFDSRTPFPGLYALLPTVGSVLIILFADRDTYVGKALGGRVLVAIGLISYSVYLWHQPVFALARNRVVAELDLLTILILIAAVFLLSYLSWRFVERPFRDRARFSRGQIFAFAGIGGVLLLAVGLVGHQYSHLGRMLPPNVRWEDLGQKIETLGDVCSTQASHDVPGIEVCYFGDTESATTVALYGDSHARAISWELDRELKRQRIRGVRLVVSGCETIPNVVEDRTAALLLPGQCDNGFRKALDFINKNVDEVIVASRWTYFLYPIVGEVETLSFDNKEGGFERTSSSRFGVLSTNGTMSFGADDKKEAVRSLLRSFSELDARVTIVYSIPEVGWDIAKLNAKHFDETGSTLDSISTSYDVYKERNRFVLSLLDEFEGGTDLHMVKPAEIFCDTFIAARCVAQWNSVPFYDDDDHLSDVGAKMLIEKAFGRFGE